MATIASENQPVINISLDAAGAAEVSVPIRGVLANWHISGHAGATTVLSDPDYSLTLDTLVGAGPSTSYYRPAATNNAHTAISGQYTMHTMAGRMLRIAVTGGTPNTVNAVRVTLDIVPL